MTNISLEKCPWCNGLGSTTQDGYIFSTHYPCPDCEGTGFKYGRLAEKEWERQVEEKWAKANGRCDMTDKERMEEIKEIYRCDGAIENLIANRIADSDIEWLIEQSEKVEELELEVNDWRAEVQKWQRFYKESEESHLETKELLKSIVNQNKRYREALKNIYELAEYNEYDNTLEQIVSEIEKVLENNV